MSDNESLSVRKNCNEKENNEKKERSNEKEHDSDKVVHYTCDICTLIFLSEDFLKRHKSRAHSNKIPVPVSLEPLPPVAKTNDIVNSCDINDFDYKANLSRKNLRIDVKNIFAGKSTSFIELIKKKYLTEEDTNNDDSDGTETDEAPTSEFSVFNAVDEVHLFRFLFHHAFSCIGLRYTHRKKEIFFFKSSNFCYLLNNSQNNVFLKRFHPLSLTPCTRMPARDL